MMRKRIHWALIAAAAVALAGCSESISEPWVSGEQAEALKGERTRTADQKQVLRTRLENYAGAYQ